MSISTDGLCLGCTQRDTCHGSNNGNPMCNCAAVMDVWRRNREKELPTIDYEGLDAGIRHVVKLLREAGFDTTDSGDGSKAETMECAWSYPMVYVQTTAAKLIAEADRLKSFLRLVGYDVQEQDPEGAVVSIQAMYCPVSGEAGLLIVGWPLTTWIGRLER